MCHCGISMGDLILKIVKKRKRTYVSDVVVCEFIYITVNRQKCQFSEMLQM